MEIKILCSCGAKFKFDVEPVQGRSPGVVLCPSCGKDSTDATNLLIEQQLGAVGPALEAAPPAPAPVVRVSAPPPAKPAGPMHVSAANVAPANVGPKMAVMPVPATSKPMSVKPPGEAAVHAAPPSAPPANASGSAGAPGSPKMAFMAAPAEGGKSLSVSGGHGKKDEPAAATAAPPVAANHPAVGKVPRHESPSAGGSRFGAGLAGGIIGAILGAIIWYVLALNVAGMRFFACIPGTLAGMGALMLAKSGTQKLAVTNAIIAAIITVLTQMAVISGINDQRLTQRTESAYAEEMAFAKKAAEARTDPQIRALMAEDSQASYSFGKGDEIDEAAIAKYRASRLVPMQKFAKGDPSRTKFTEKKRAELAEDPDNLYRIKMISMAIWIISGISSAFKIPLGKE